MNTRTPQPPTIVRAIDGLTGFVGKFVSWLTLIMVAVAAFNAIFRYLGRFIGVNLSSNAYIEMQWYMFSVVFLLGAAYALREDSHVRVDVLYSRVSERTQHIINIAGTLILLLPFCLFMLWVSYPIVRSSWLVREGSPDPGGLPRYPLKALVVVCFVLLTLQGVAELIKEIQRLRAHVPAPEPEKPAEGAI